MKKQIKFTRKIIRTEVAVEEVVLSDDEVDLPDWLIWDGDEKSEDGEYQEKLCGYVWDEHWSGHVVWGEAVETVDVQCEEIYDIEVEYV